MDQKISQDVMRRRNRSAILQSLRLHGPLARVDLGKQLDISPATVTAITSDLLDQGLINHAHETETKHVLSRGRPRTLLSLKSDAMYVVVLRFSIERIIFKLVDYAGQIVRTSHFTPDDETISTSELLDFIVSAIQTLLDEAHVSSNVVQKICVAVQGPVDVEKGLIVWTPVIRDRHIPIVSALNAAFQSECFLPNDTNMITEALHWTDPNKYNGTFVVLMLEYGVGMGVFVNNQLFSGAHGLAAEFGHSNHIPGGALCRCGKRGCIEAYVSDYAIARATQKNRAGADITVPAAGDVDLENVISRAEEGDADALAAFYDAGKALGFGLARILAILDPSRIVMTGTVVRGYEFMKHGVQDGLDEALVAELRQTIHTDVLPWSEDLIFTGLMAKALKQLDFDSYHMPDNVAVNI